MKKEKSRLKTQKKGREKGEKIKLKNKHNERKCRRQW